MRIDNSHFSSILKKSVEKSMPSECTVRTLTEEEKTKYSSIKPTSKKSFNDYIGHIVSHRKRCI